MRLNPSARLHSQSITGTRRRARLLGSARLGHSVLLGLTLAGVVLIATSCGSKKPPGESARIFTDELGLTVALTRTPERIVSLAPSITESLFELGLGDRLVGVTTFCDYPPEAALKEKVGDTMRPSIEKIIGLKPDLVIVSTASQLEDFAIKLEEVGIPVYRSNPRNLGGVLESIERIAELAGVGDHGRSLIQLLRARIDVVRARVSGRHRPSVLVILGNQPLITAGGNTFVNDLIDRAGGRSISAEETVDYPQFSLETALAKQPEVIFLQSGESELPDRLKQTPAARAGRVYHLDDALLLRPGPRIVDGLEQMAARIHAE